MSKHKRIFAVLAVIIMIAVSVYPVFAQEDNSHSISVINTVGLNNINISISQYDVIDGVKRAIDPNPLVLPGQTINRVCEINNLANDAWIRAKIEFADGTPNVDDSLLEISSDEWKRCGEYYYFVEPVSHKDTVTLFDKIVIPTEWDNTYAGKTINFTVYADAVQRVNFEPDFESSDPWFGTVIEYSMHNEYIAPSDGDNQQFQVIYRDGAEGLVKVGEDFFSNWGALMPGDVVKDKVVIKNNYIMPTTIYFQINNIDDGKLLEKLRLRIYTANREIYKGGLKGNVEDEIELVTLKHGEELEVFYEVEVPAELTNEFSLTKTKTEWIFRAYSENMQPPSPDATSYISPEEQQQFNPSFAPNDGSPVQTGDMFIYISIGIAVLLVLAAIVIVIAQGGRKNEEK